jgi:hypothetical protein
MADLSYGSGDWSKTLTILDDGFKSINSSWITNMRTIKTGIILQGFSLYRDRIPRIANLFKNAELQKVVVTNIRKTTAYKFTIFIKKDFKNINNEHEIAAKQVASK